MQVHVVLEPAGRLELLEAVGQRALELVGVLLAVVVEGALGLEGGLALRGSFINDVMSVLRG